MINLSEHYGILEGLCEELNVFLAVFHSLINNLEIFCKCREEFRAAKFLSNLILVYESSKNSILTEAELSSFNDAYARLKEQGYLPLFS